MSAVDVEIDRYLSGVRAALADLPTEVQDDLVDDLPAHFAELLDEHRGPLVERLGPPESYAAELRTAAGLGARTGARRRWLSVNDDLADKAFAAARTADLKIGAVIGYPKATDFVRLLRPAWWVFRAYVVALLFFEVTLHENPLFTPVGWVVLIALSLLSVRIGPITSRLVQWARVPAVAAAVVVVFVAVAGSPARTYYQPSSDGYSDRWSQVTDVYPYDKDGNPLSDVYLYDQNGTPMEFGDAWRCATDDQRYGAQPYVPRYPLCKGPVKASPSPSPSASSSPSPSSSPSLSPSASASK
jgi:hypothetical protein